MGFAVVAMTFDPFAHTRALLTALEAQGYTHLSWSCAACGLECARGFQLLRIRGRLKKDFDRFIGRPPIALSQVLSPAGTRYGYALKGQVRLCEPKKQGVLTSACKARSVRSRIRPSFAVLAG